jgi:hypothetical protein
MTQNPSQSAAERRIWPRHVFDDGGSNLPVATVGVYPRCAFVQDLSPGGISLLTTEPPPLGAVVPVWLPGRQNDPAPMLLVSVVHVAPHSEGLFRVGGELVDEASAAAARALLP